MNKPKEIIQLSTLNQSLWHKVTSTYGDEQYIPKIIDLKPDSLQEYQNKWRFLILFFKIKKIKNIFRQMKCLLSILIILLILIIISIVIVIIIIPILFIQPKSKATSLCFIYKIF